jgi:predicted TIM-barrel fold metal-dependent hydrolase
MRVIDAHVHLYPPDANADPVAWGNARRESEWVSMCTRRRRNGMPVQAFPSVEELLREMDRAGVERSVLLGWYWHHAETCGEQNRFYARCLRAHPDRLSAFATIQPAHGLRITFDEMERARSEGLVGLGELSPHAQSYSVNDGAFRAALERAATWKWPVNLHVTDPNSRDYPGRVETPLDDFVSLARENPSTTFILAHWGGLLPLRDATASSLDNLHYDTAASPLLYDASVWTRMLACTASERILFGSDFPLNVYPKDQPRAELARFVDEARGARVGSDILRENATRLLARAAIG